MTLRMALGASVVFISALTMALAAGERDIYFDPYGGVQPPAPPPDEAGAQTAAAPSGFTLYTVKDGDTLASIAAEQLGNPRLASTIARLNRIRDPRSLKGGMVLVLPAPRFGFEYTIELLTDCDFKQVPPSHRFKTGDHFRLRVRQNVDGYLYIFNKGTSGKTSVLFPDVRIDGGKNVARRFQELVVPAQGWFTFSGKPGTESMYIFLSRKPISGFIQTASSESAEVSQGEWATIADAYQRAGSSATRDVVLASPGQDSDVPQSSSYVVSKPGAGVPYVVVQVNLKHQ